MQLKDLYIGAKVEVDKGVAAKNEKWTIKKPSTIGIVEQFYEHFVLIRMLNYKGKPLYLESFMPDDIVKIIE